MSEPTCSHPEWTTAAKLLHLIGEFRDRDVQGMVLRRCASCGRARLDVHVSGAKVHRIALSQEKGEALLEADRAFWTALRSWARN